jgi:hypothetical protein
MPMPEFAQPGKRVAEGQEFAENDQPGLAVLLVLPARREKIGAVVELASSLDVEILRAEQEIAVVGLADVVHRLVQRTVLEDALVDDRLGPDEEIGFFRRWPEGELLGLLQRGVSVCWKSI